MKQIVLAFIVVLCGLNGIVFAASDDIYEDKRMQMVRTQIEARGISDQKVLKAMRDVPRHLFVPPKSRSAAYEDHPLSIGYGQTISQPYIVGFMTEAALLQAEDKVLEIGTGSGYQAAVLAELEIGRAHV